MAFGSKQAIGTWRTLALFLATAMSLAAPAHAATVVLSNGDQITGELIQLAESTLTFKSSLFGEVKIPWSAVKKLISDEGVRVQLNDGTTVRGRVVLDDKGVVDIDQGRLGQYFVVKRRDISALNPTILDESVKYSGRLNVGGSLNRGNAIGEQLNVNGEFVARTPKDRYTLGVEVNEATSGGIKITSNRRLLAQYDVFLNEKNYLFINGKAEKDRFADLNLRASLGTGYGRQFIDSDTTKLSAQVGLTYVNEDYGISADQSFPTLSLGLKYDESFFDNKLIYFQTLNIDSSLEDTRDALLHTSLGLRVPIAKGVNVSTQLNVDYDNRPAEGKRKQDTALIFSVGYGF